MASDSPSSSAAMNVFHPPACMRGAKQIERMAFLRHLPTAAASVRDMRDIAKYRQQLMASREILNIERISSIAPDPNPAKAAQGSKCLVLKPSIKPAAPETWSPVLKEACDSGRLKVVPLELPIGYEVWSYLDVVRSILPEELHGEIPVGFNTVGHVAHLNLREQYLPYKKVIAQVIIDKNAHIRSVINKIDNVGTGSEFRTFAYEVLAGTRDMEVEVSEDGNVFRFDYSAVYWNSKLGTEHRRIAELFKPGEAVADVMAGVGPFAAPAGKRGVFVWANDKNPACFEALKDTITRNKLGKFVRPFNYDGHDFIRIVVDRVLESWRRGDAAHVKPAKTSRSTSPSSRPQPTVVPVPPTISHFVMNLPASALEFLHNYRGLYHGNEQLFVPHTETKLPMIHAHCFAAKAEDATPLDDICQRIYNELGVRFVPGDAEKDGEVTIHEVRDVAPAKRMFCASFRLPPEVAFAERS